MPVSNGQVANANTFNTAFMDRQTDTSTVGKVDLLDPDSANSGATISNIQKEMNSQNAFTGHPAGSAHNATPIWTNTDVGTGTDTLKARAEAITIKFDGTTGHAHTGVDGDGAKVNAQTLTSCTTGAIGYGGNPDGLQFDATNLFWDATNFRLGLKTGAPNTTIDVNGDSAIRFSDVATAATITALSTSTSYVRLTGATATDIQGIASGFNGKILFLSNVSSATVTVSHQDVGATAANRIISPTGVDVALSPNASMILIYDSTQSRWIIVSSGTGSTGSTALSVTATKTANYTASIADDVIPCDASGGDFTITLPTASGNSGEHFYIKNKSTGTVTIDANSTELIDGQLTQVLQNQFDVLHIVADGTGWLII